MTGVDHGTFQAARVLARPCIEGEDIRWGIACSNCGYDPRIHGFNYKGEAMKKWDGVQVDSQLSIVARGRYDTQTYMDAWEELARRWEAYDTMKEALREAADSLSNSLKRITLIDGGITDENEELYYAGIAALDNATDAFAGADRCTITATGRAALAAERAK